MSNAISSNEIAAFFRSSFPEISGDNLSRYLCSDEGIKLAENFQKDVYPQVARHLSVRNRFFFDRSKEILKSKKFDTVLSLGSGLSLLTYYLSKAAPEITFIDSDIFEVITNRTEKLKDLKSTLPGIDKIKTQIFDLESKSQSEASFHDLIRKTSTPLIIMEGVSYFLTQKCLTWIFNQVATFKTCAIIFDYWPSYAKQSKTFKEMLKTFETSLSEEVKSTFSESDLMALSAFKVIEDIELRDAEALYASDLQLSELDHIVPARFRILSNT